MKHTGSSLYQVSNPGWELLGELELTVMFDTDRAVNKWLRITLGGLDLRDEILNKILSSAQEATSRALRTETVTKPEHIHLLVFVLAERSNGRGSWGFFRIEKIETPVSGKSTREHEIEFYLYLEGQ